MSIPMVRSKREAVNKKRRPGRQKQKHGSGTRVPLPLGIVVCARIGSNAQQLQLAAAASAELAGTLQLRLQAVPGDVQAALDRADRRLELTAHLLQGSAVQVERLQRRTV